MAGQANVIDLLDSRVFLELSAEPYRLEKMSGKAGSWVVIDEIQKLPTLLDEVHRLIELKKCRFLLTGSSARKLRREGVNLLGGRARKAELFPLVSAEIPDFDLNRALEFGTLPAVYLSEEPKEDLTAYCGTYLSEEVHAESLVRNLPAFSRFLKTAAISNGEIVNFTAIGSDAMVKQSTVRDHFSILVDTYLGFFLDPWRTKSPRKTTATPKFYFFDNGVANTLSSIRNLDRNSDRYGKCFEAWGICEVRAYLSYRRKLDESLFFFLTPGDREVDLIVSDHTAIEFKATRRISKADWRGLEGVQDTIRTKQRILVSQDPLTVDREKGLRALHWKEFARMLWAGELL